MVKTTSKVQTGVCRLKSCVIWEECSSSATAVKENPVPQSLALLMMSRDKSLSLQVPSPTFVTHFIGLRASKTLQSEPVQGEGYPSISGQDLFKSFLVGAGRKEKNREEHMLFQFEYLRFLQSLEN